MLAPNNPKQFIDYIFNISRAYFITGLFCGVIVGVVITLIIK